MNIINLTTWPHGDGVHLFSDSVLYKFFTFITML